MKILLNLSLNYFTSNN